MRLPHDTEELMRQWLLLEPSRCDFSTEYDMWRVMAGNRQHVVCGAQIIDYPRLQIALQEAIEARGWNWVIQRQQSGVYLALASSYIAAFDLETMSTDGATPAEALLAAYLQALKANA